MSLEDRLAAIDKKYEGQRNTRKENAADAIRALSPRLREFCAIAGKLEEKGFWNPMPYSALPKGLVVDCQHMPGGGCLYNYGYRPTQEPAQFVVSGNTVYLFLGSEAVYVGEGKINALRFDAGRYTKVMPSTEGMLLFAKEFDSFYTAFLAWFVDTFPQPQSNGAEELEDEDEDEDEYEEDVPPFPGMMKGFGMVGFTDKDDLGNLIDFLKSLEK